MAANTGFVRQTREYQSWAKDSFFAYFNEHDGHPVIAMPTGTGKSVTIADICIEIVVTWNGQRILILAPSKELVEQNGAKFTAMAPHLPVGVCSASLNRYEIGRPITIGTIGTIYNRRDKLGHIDLVFIDECHLVSHKDETQYRLLADYLLERNPLCKFVGLSATPYRLGLGHITDGGLFTDVCFDACGLDAFNWFIDQGYLLPLIPRPTKTILDTSGVGTAGGDYIAGQLQRKINKAEVTSAAVVEALELSAGRKKLLWFATGIEHAESIVAELEAHGETAVAVHSKSVTRDEDLQAFMTLGDNGVRHCVNFGVLTTGFDFPALDCIVMLRPTKSPGLWCLDEQTEVMTPDGFKRFNEIDVGADCCAYSMTTGEIVTTRVDAYIHRDALPGEQFYTLQRPGIDIRVTGKHNMLAQLGRGRGLYLDMALVPVEKLASHDKAKIPVSGVSKKPGLGLSREACLFVGYWLADGTHDKSNNAIQFAISDRYPTAKEQVTSWLDALNIAYRTHYFGANRVSANGYTTQHGQTRYQVSFGASRKQPGKIGWALLASYLHKGIVDDLFNMSEQEVDWLFEGMNVGDGQKYTASSVTWTPRTYSIAMGHNVAYADRAQRLAVGNGYRASVSRANPTCFVLQLKKARVASVCKQRNGSDWKIEPCAEKVWCVQNEIGTLVTRRNGKVVIMGNCQMLGRGTRPWYADGFDLSTLEGRLLAILHSDKQDCLVLDFAYNTAILGPINDPQLPKKKKKLGGDPPIKTCGKTGNPPVSNIVPHTSNPDKGGDPIRGCGIWNHPSARHCIQCGAEFTFEVKFSHTASNTALLKKSGDDSGAFEKPTMEQHRVTRVTYEIHKKDGRPDSIRVNYHCGMRRFSHYVLPEHGGNPRRRSEDWWMRHGGGELPSTTNMARARIDQLKTPSSITVWIKKDFPQIMDWTFDG